MKLKQILFTATVCVLCVGQAAALEYTVDAPGDYLFARPTSQDVIYQQESVNVDRSKDTVLVAPGFGTPTSYLPDTGEYLTPNLVPGYLSGGLVNSVTSADYTDFPSAPNASTGSSSGSSFDWSISDGSGWAGTGSYTAVTSDLYYSGGYLGVLKIPAIGVNTKIYQGTDSATLAKGIGHFENTSIWSGNVCLAAHNRGTNSYFGKIHTLDVGDTITLTTKLGTRTYSVTSVEKISETDNSMLSSTAGNCITLFTCVRDESAYRWCVRAVLKA